ncbi:bifunctional lysylphosphatidylglycerol flippase/synthetase MprF [Streptomyces albireticuli]|uniref:bifunctional lysylphosphatidylglycerol flippase/synthetase MprF n=1 Tax=Streptomyces albireticuli TaxID=1940 RepID=UPI003685704E
MSATATATATGAQILQAVTRYTGAQNPSAFLALNRGNHTFTLPHTDGVIVYRRTGRYAVQFAGPFAPEDTYVPLLEAFRTHLRSEGLILVGVQLQHTDALAYARHGFTVNQIGASWALPLREFTLRGTPFMQLRNKISRALRNGLQIQEADRPEQWHEALAAVDKAWLGAKGDHARELRFLVGERGGSAQAHRRLFVGTIEGQAVAYLSYSPVFGTRQGWLHDLSRRIPGGSPGLMEALNAHAIEVFRGEGARWLHFGFTPFTGLDAQTEIPGHSPAFQWLMHYLWEHGQALYPARTQLAYKHKWAAREMIPEYVAFDGPASLAAFVHIFRACNAL